MKLLEKPNIRELTWKRGIAYPTDEELIMLIIGSGTKDIPIEKLAHRIIQTMNESNTDDFVRNMLKIRGMGKSKALAIAAAIELGRRRTNKLGAVINQPEDVVPFVRSYSMDAREHFICVILNGGHEIIDIQNVSTGTVNRALVHPREIFCEAIRQNAAAIIICHNHPSENCAPSDEDIHVTQTLQDCATLLGISLLDHIVFSQTSYFSFKENGMLFTE